MDYKEIVFIAKATDGLAIKKYNIATKKFTQLTPWTKHTIGAITIGKEHVYFDADYTGVTNIFAVALNGDKKIKQLYTSKKRRKHVVLLGWQKKKRQENHY